MKPNPWATNKLSPVTIDLKDEFPKGNSLIFHLIALESKFCLTAQLNLQVMYALQNFVRVAFSPWWTIITSTKNTGGFLFSSQFNLPLVHPLFWYLLHLIGTFSVPRLHTPNAMQNTKAIWNWMLSSLYLNLICSYAMLLEIFATYYYCTVYVRMFLF